jgi:hypothetical protein
MRVFLVQQVIHSGCIEHLQLVRVQNGIHWRRPGDSCYELCAIQSLKEAVMSYHAVARRCQEHLES